MKRVVIALLKFLLQLFLLLVTGRWVQIGRPPRPRAPRPKPKPRPQLFDPAASRQRGRKVSAGRAAEPWAMGEGPAYGPISLEVEGELVEPDAATLEALRSWDLVPAQQGTRRKRRRKRQRKPSPSVQADASPLATAVRPRTLGAAFRDRRALHQALIVQAALGPRRPRR